MSAAELQRIWETQIVERLRPLAAGVFRDAEVLGLDRNVVTIRLSDGVPVDQARRRGNEAEAVLSELLDQTIRIELSDAVTASSPATPPAASPASAEQAAAPQSATSASDPQDKVQRLVEHFPGSVVVRDGEGAT